jgi:RimJ/RimL family protein N-acetyltransferase
MDETWVVSVLRGILEADLPVFFEHQRDPEATRMAAFPPRDREAFMAHWHRILANGDVPVRTVLHEGRVAGNIVCFQRDDKHLVGYWIGREFWGKGLATRALAEFVTVVTHRPLHAYVATSNLGSVRVLEKCGFTLVGYQTEHDEALGEEIEEALYVLA